jgi:3-deoxy-D-manno-octulosonic acid (KDO) 8-phosphate synthase
MLGVATAMTRNVRLEILIGQHGNAIEEIATPQSMLFDVSASISVFQFPTRCCRCSQLMRATTGSEAHVEVKRMWK